MIASLTGMLERSTPGEIVINVGGVGYRVMVPLSTYARLPREGKEASLRIATVVREDEISLYGFASEEEQWLFKLLQGVTGVGPKLALKILSGIDPMRLREALSAGDTAVLNSVSGVGKKLAQRLVVELRDKVGALDSDTPIPLTEVGSFASEGVDALIALGYQPKVARQAVEAARRDGAERIEDIVRHALRALAPKR